MNTIDELATKESKLDQIPIGFKLLAKEELKKEIRQINPSYILDPDKTYIKVARDETIDSESLTDTLLKKSIGEASLLNDLLVEPHHIDPENRIEKLDIPNIKNCIDRLSAVLSNTFRKQVETFWKPENLSVPPQLQNNPEDFFSKNLINYSLITEKIDQISTTHPNVRQTIISYLKLKLRRLYSKDVSPHTVRIDIFTQREKKDLFGLLSIKCAVIYD